MRASPHQPGQTPSSAKGERKTTSQSLVRRRPLTLPSRRPTHVDGPKRASARPDSHPIQVSEGVGVIPVNHVLRKRCPFPRHLPREQLAPAPFSRTWSPFALAPSRRRPFSEDAYRSKREFLLSSCPPSELGLVVAALGFPGFPAPSLEHHGEPVGCADVPTRNPRSVVYAAPGVPPFLFLVYDTVTSACRPCLGYPHKSGSCRNSIRASLPALTLTSCCSLASFHLRLTNSPIYSSLGPVLQSLLRPAVWSLVNPPNRLRRPVGRRHARGGPR